MNPNPTGTGVGVEVKVAVGVKVAVAVEVGRVGVALAVVVALGVNVIVGVSVIVGVGLGVTVTLTCETLGALVALGEFVLPNNGVTFTTRVGKAGCGLMSGEVMAQAVRSKHSVGSNRRQKRFMSND